MCLWIICDDGNTSGREGAGGRQQNGKKSLVIDGHSDIDIRGIILDRRCGGGLQQEQWR